MSGNKNINKICFLVIAFTVILGLVFINGKALGIDSLQSETDTEYFSKADVEGDWDREDATKIVLKGDSVEISGSGATAKDKVVYISKPGKYAISGNLTEGQIVVAASSEDEIWIALDNVIMSNDSDAPLYIEQAKKVYLTLVKDSVNNFTRGSGEVKGGIDGCIYSKDDVSINGTGEIIISSNNGHGLVCNDSLVISDAALDIKASADGIHVNDAISIREAALTINAGDDGITCKNDKEDSLIYIESGGINITECYEGIEACSITVDGGDINIYSTDDGLNACATSGNITINDGNIRIINTDGRDADGLDSNGNIHINGGNIFISVNSSGGSSAIDYGSESGGTCSINGGRVIACGSGSMQETILAPGSQGIITLSTESGVADSSLSVRDSDGNTIIEGTKIPCQYNWLMVSDPEITIGESYTLTIDGEENQVDADSQTSGGGFRGPGGGRNPGGFSGDGEMPEKKFPRDGNPPEKPDGRGFQEGENPPDPPESEM